jgi:hypothetical protein
VRCASCLSALLLCQIRVIHLRPHGRGNDGTPSTFPPGRGQHLRRSWHRNDHLDLDCPPIQDDAPDEPLNEIAPLLEAEHPHLRSDRADQLLRLRKPLRIDLTNRPRLLQRSEPGLVLCALLLDLFDPAPKLVVEDVPELVLAKKTFAPFLVAPPPPWFASKA